MYSLNLIEVVVFMTDLQLFMYLYMYELELWLNEHSDEVLKISFQSDEANTDRPLKEFLKKSIEQNCNSLSKLKNINLISIKGKHHNISSSVRNTVINSVLLPPISDNIKRILKDRKKSVYTEPDICLVILMNNTPQYVTIELKSTKNDAIPGSSIQQIDPNEWVVFIKHNNKKVDITTGQYFQAINAKMQFPDRSPRPQVSFKELCSWNRNCRNITENNIVYSSTGDESEKHALLTDWQGVLANRWTKIVMNTGKIKKSEPWFNNNLRKFILEFLDEYDKMSPQSQKDYKDFLKNVIK